MKVPTQERSISTERGAMLIDWTTPLVHQLF